MSLSQRNDIAVFHTCLTCKGSGIESELTSTSGKKICTTCYGSGLKVDPNYICLIDQSDIDLAEDKYARREIQKVTINNQDFYVCYEEPSDKNDQCYVVYTWPCKWGWSGKIDGNIFYVNSKIGLIYLIKALLDNSNYLYTFTDEGVYQIKNQPTNEILTPPIINNPIMQ